jgi:hypothetical protein
MQVEVFLIYRSWLSSAISEAERLHRAQNSSLNAAENAIQESRQKLKHAFDRLSQLQMDINANLDSENKPVAKNFCSRCWQESRCCGS